MNTTAFYSGKKWESGHTEDVLDCLIVEEMLSISVNGKPYTITMRTPGHEEAHSRGILFTENVFTSVKTNPVFEIVQRKENGWITHVDFKIPDSLLESGIEQQRNLLSVSSCGLCGKYEFEIMKDEAISDLRCMQAKDIETSFQRMAMQQTDFNQSGGCHAAALIDEAGNVLDVKEDIGRHNAVDKVIGSLLLSHQLNLAVTILVSGRISYEIVSKAHKARIPILCSVSAPSSMAVDHCNRAGITLLAFCRKNKFTVYTHPHRIIY